MRAEIHTLPVDVPKRVGYLSRRGIFTMRRVARMRPDIPAWQPIDPTNEGLSEQLDAAQKADHARLLSRTAMPRAPGSNPGQGDNGQISALLEFAVIATGEIDGTVYLRRGDSDREVSNV